MTDVIKLKDVRKVYAGDAEQAVLEGVSATVAEGEFMAIMGSSGSGKSTLLNLIAGLDRPTKGTVIVAGQDLGSLNEGELARFRRERLGFIFQFFNLLANLTVLENVLIPAQLAGLPSAEALARGRQLLEELEISHRADIYPSRLSGGERQRVAIARALINRPRVLLADEPTGALDTRSGDQVMALLSRLNSDGQTILLVTHDAKLAACHAHRVLTLRDGHVVDDTTLDPALTATAGELIRVRAEEPGR